MGKRNGRHRNGTHAKHRRARIARRLKRADERRALAAIIGGMTLVEGRHVFERYYQPMTHLDFGTPAPGEAEAVADVLRWPEDASAGAIVHFALPARKRHDAEGKG